MTDKTCGNCRYFQEEDKPPENIVERAKFRPEHPWPICKGDGKIRDPNGKPCMIWTQRT